MTSTMQRLVLALALVTFPVSAGAQTTSTDTAATDVQNDTITTQTESDGTAGNEVQGVQTRTETRQFPWGLLGLLGLAGLMGRNQTVPQVMPQREVKLGGPTDGPRQS